jgi:hypothetical protein
MGHQPIVRLESGGHKFESLRVRHQQLLSQDRAESQAAGGLIWRDVVTTLMTRATWEAEAVSCCIAERGGSKSSAEKFVAWQ